MTYVAGMSAEELREIVQVERVIKLGSNENPRGPSAQVMEELARAGDALNLYPGAELTGLCEVIRSTTGVPSGGVVVGNGSCDVLVPLIADCMSEGDEAIVPQPSFRMHALAVERANGTVVSIPHRNFAFDLAAMRSAVTSRTRVVFLTNPNNPTGLALDPAELRDLLDALPASVLVVIDEAYCEFVDPDVRIDGVELLREGYNVVVVRTFSKLHALASLRVGYGLMATERADRLRAQQLPFHVGGLALRAARAALSDLDHVEASRKLNADGRSFLLASLAELGLSVLPSQANHVLIVDLADAAAVNASLNAQGFIVRPTAASFGLEGGLRVTVGTEEQNVAFVKALSIALTDAA